MNTLFFRLLAEGGDIVPDSGGSLLRDIAGDLVGGAIDGVIDTVTGVIEAGAEVAQAAADLVQIRLLHSILDQLVCFIPNLMYFVLSITDSFLRSLVSVLPDTPESMKLSTMVSGLSSVTPLLNTAEIEQIIQGIFGMLAILLVYKLFKMLPFVG